MELRGTFSVDRQGSSREALSWDRHSGRRFRPMKLVSNFKNIITTIWKHFENYNNFGSTWTKMWNIVKIIDWCVRAEPLNDGEFLLFLQNFPFSMTAQEFFECRTSKETASFCKVFWGGGFRQRFKIDKIKNISEKEIIFQNLQQVFLFQKRK